MKCGFSFYLISIEFICNSDEQMVILGTLQLCPIAFPFLCGQVSLLPTTFQVLLPTLHFNSLGTPHLRSKMQERNFQKLISKSYGYGIQFGACSMLQARQLTALKMRDNSQCSLASDYGYKRWNTNREAPCACTQPENLTTNVMHRVCKSKYF